MPFWVAALVVASLQPWRPYVRHNGPVHGVLHFLAFFSTALLLLLAARTPRRRVYAPLAVFALGAALELTQRLLYRNAFEWSDLAIDLGAALFAAALAWPRPLRETLVR